MLVLQRYPEDRIRIGSDIEIKVLEIRIGRSRSVKLGITAPKNVEITRVGCPAHEQTSVKPMNERTSL